ncbi:hypothetical protein AVEN_72407-1 [Araneus ventricosus]|uniref:Uncharacterized protein n=1 Tax=Araneus ventricosus TaxID=182803 RepID=A0A4Y2ILY0_ARAVE|nr:hypothetical protein AVEN_72407-1 [Araneus ventricosus]
MDRRKIVGVETVRRESLDIQPFLISIAPFGTPGHKSTSATQQIVEKAEACSRWCGAHNSPIGFRDHKDAQKRDWCLRKFGVEGASSGFVLVI